MVGPASLPLGDSGALALSLSSEMMHPPRPRSRPHTLNQLPSASTSTHNFSTHSEELDWSLSYAPHSFSHSRPLSASHSVYSPLPVSQDPVPPVPSYKTCSSSDSDKIPYSESSPPRPLFRLAKTSALPDPSQFPDPSPFRPHQYLSSGPPILWWFFYRFNMLIRRLHKFWECTRFR
jgi:hypothetical protein